MQPGGFTSMAQKNAERRKRPVNGAGGELIIIDGHEDKASGQPQGILHIVAQRVNGGSLLIATLASSEAVEQWETYRKTFHDLGVKKLERLDLETREQSDDDGRAELLRHARVVFFTGGDQLRITSSFGG